jgi:hypothetical protein
MSATYHAAAKTLMTIEGGYCSGGMQCGTPESGETYRGIDRGFHPNWAGWKLIDNYKKQFGTPKRYSFFSAGIGQLINNEVEKFWTGWWNKYGFQQLKNNDLAGLLYAWCAQGPTRAIDQINDIGKKYGAKKTNKATITPEVAAAINANLAKAYQDSRNVIIATYKRIQPTRYQTFIKNRVDVFPIAIPDAKPATGTPTEYGSGSAGKSGNSSGGFLGWLASVFTLISIR